MSTPRNINELNSFIFQNFCSFNSTSLKNGHLLYAFQKNGKSIPKTISFFLEMEAALNKAALQVHLGKLLNTMKNCVKSLKYERVWRKAEDLMQTPYVLPTTSTTTSTTTTTTTTTSVCHSINLRKDCDRCRQKRVELEEALSKCRRLRAEVRRARTFSLKNKRLSQALARKCSTEKVLRRERRFLKRKIRSLEARPSTTELEKENRRLRRALDGKQQTVGELDDQLNAVNKELTNLSQEVKNLQIANDYLVSSTEEAEEVDDFEPVGGRHYSSKMRKVIYKTLISQVPVAHSGGVVSYVLQELGNSNEVKVPHKSTVARMAYELSALSHLQVAEAVLKCECATLCWDATTYAAQHANQIHISTESATFTLSIAELASGSAKDYTRHIISVIDEIATSYSIYSGQDFISIKNDFLSKISSTVSDRAPVNHCVVEQLKEELEVDIMELNCNVHPLDGFASHTCSALGNLDKEDGLPSNGRGDCCAANFIYAISKIRYKQTGDPSGFKSFMARKDIPSDVFVRYVGNRLHVMFRMAGSIVAYKSELLEYLERFCRLEARRTLLRDLNDNRMVAQFQALGLCGKLITGPWMTLFYGNSHRLSNLEMGEYIRLFDKNLTAFIEQPLNMLTSSSDVFDNAVPASNVLTSLRNTEDPALLQKYLTAILAAFKKVTCNQLGKYITGILSMPSDADLQSTKSASPNNIWAERSLGMTDALWRRAPNASLGFLDAKVKARTNRTLPWLDTHDSNTQERLIKYAVKRGSYLRAAHSRWSKNIGAAKQERQLLVGQARDKKMRRALEKEVKESLIKQDPTNSIYEGLSLTQKGFINKIIHREDVLGSLFQHTWESEEGVDVTYWGRIRAVIPATKSRPSKFTLGYWDLDAAESSSEDYDMDVSAVLADMVTADLSFF